MSDHNWIPIPCTGALLKECSFVGDGKRGALHLVCEGHPKAVLATCRVELLRLSGVHQTIRSIDDMTVEVALVPAEGRRVVVTRAELDNWIEEDDAQKIFASWHESGSWEADAEYSLRLALEEAPASEEGQNSEPAEPQP
ncbi:hypothetical protein L6R52_31595 [Myxococcota bacterium]|nr:hypothetical protein [Myxococcota bacterium]